MKTTTTYTIMPALYEMEKLEVKVSTTNEGVVDTTWLRNLRGRIRVFTTRSAARKAITRELRRVAGEPGALHR